MIFDIVGIKKCNYNYAGTSSLYMVILELFWSAVTVLLRLLKKHLLKKHHHACPPSVRAGLMHSKDLNRQALPALLGWRIRFSRWFCDSRYGMDNGLEER